MSKPHTIEFIKKIAESKKCKLLSTEYKNQKQKLDFECSEGHKFTKSFGLMLHQKQSCSICSRGISEELCRYVFEFIFDDKFKKITFNFKNHNLELDGYNEINNVAFEYNGRQHYELTKMTKTNELLEYRKYLDNLKIEYCKENDIKLIIIPYTIKNNEISDFICKNLNVHKKINIKDFIDNYSYFRKRKKIIEDIIQEKKGRLIEFNFDDIKLSCDKNHEWTSRFYTIKKGHWCKKCSYLGLKNTPNSKRNKENINKILKEVGISVLNIEEYINGSSVLDFKCNKGHTFKDSLDYLLERIKSPKKENRKVCQYCLTHRQENVLKKIEGKGLMPVNILLYKNRSTPIDWICINGCRKTDKLKNIIEKMRRNTDLCNCKKCKNINILKTKKNKVAHNSKRIVCLENKTEYQTIKKASENLNISSASIVNVLKGRASKTKGYSFQYI
jgi:hypothetical protein